MFAPIYAVAETRAAEPRQRAQFPHFPRRNTRRAINSPNQKASSEKEQNRRVYPAVLFCSRELQRGSKRSRFITLFQAAAKSPRNFSPASPQA